MLAESRVRIDMNTIVSFPDDPLIIPLVIRQLSKVKESFDAFQSIRGAALFSTISSTMI